MIYLWMYSVIFIYNTRQSDGTIFRGCHDPYFSGENIALGQKTQQSGVYLNQVSSNAVDGNTDTSATYGTCAHTAVTNTTPFWEVYFEIPYTITGIIIYSRSNYDNRFRLKDFKVYGLPDYVFKTLIYDDAIEQQYNERIMLIKNDEYRDQEFIGIRIEANKNTNPNVDGGTSMLTLCEVEIYSPYENNKLSTTTTTTISTPEMNITGSSVNVTKTLTTGRHVCVVVGVISGIGGAVIATVILITVWYTKLRGMPKDETLAHTNNMTVVYNAESTMSEYNDLRSDSRHVPMYEPLKTEKATDSQPTKPSSSSAAAATTTDDEYNYIHPQGDSYEKVL